MTSVQQPRPATGSDPKPAPPPALRDSFEHVVRSHQSMVWRYLRLLGADAHEADDLMQDAFVRLAEVSERGEQPLSPAAFLRGVARNLLIGARRRSRNRPVTVAWADEVDQLVATSPEALDDRRIDALRRCVARLGGRMQQAVQWHHVDGVSCGETARRLGIGAEGIKSLLQRARNALRECVEQQLRGGEKR